MSFQEDNEFLCLLNKHCTACKQEKPLVEFHKNRHSNDGFHDECKQCRKIQRRKLYALASPHLITDERKLYMQHYRQERRQKDPSFRMRLCLSTRIHHALKGLRKSNRTLVLVGCSVEGLWLYLESKFESGMTRENYGSVWEVDHIIPCALFNLSLPEHQQRCFHFSNLQPLFAVDNHRKSASQPTSEESAAVLQKWKGEVT